MKTQTTTLECPRQMVGRIIGKNGETVKALQTYTGATIQIDQATDPTQVSISGPPYSLSLALSMVTDIVRGSFKGFALLRQSCRPVNGRLGYAAIQEPRPIYAPGYGLIPASQLYDDRSSGPPIPGNIYPQRQLPDRVPQLYPTHLIAAPHGQNVLAMAPDGSLHNGSQYGAPPVHSAAANLVSAQLQQLSNLHHQQQQNGAQSSSANGHGQEHAMHHNFGNPLNAVSNAGNLLQAGDQYHLLPVSGGTGTGEDYSTAPPGSRLLQIAGRNTGLSSSPGVRAKSFY